MAIDANILSQLITMQPGGQPPRNVFEKASREMEDERQRQADRKTSQNLQALKFIQGQQDRQMSLSDRDIRLARDATREERADIDFGRSTTRFEQEQGDRKDRLGRQKLTWKREDDKYKQWVNSVDLENKALVRKGIQERGDGIRAALPTRKDFVGDAGTYSTKNAWTSVIGREHAERAFRDADVENEEDKQAILNQTYTQMQNYLSNAGTNVASPNELGSVAMIGKNIFDNVMASVVTPGPGSERAILNPERAGPSTEGDLYTVVIE